MPKGNKCVSLHIENGSVVQLDRIADSGSVGWGFESLRSHTGPLRREGFFMRRLRAQDSGCFARSCFNSCRALLACNSLIPSDLPGLVLRHSYLGAHIETRLFV